MLIAVLALLISSCGTSTATQAPAADTQAPIAADTPILPTQTPIPAANTPEPIAEPTLEPTPLPAVFDAALLFAVPDLPAFKQAYTETRLGADADDQPVDLMRSVIMEFDRELAFSHFDIDVTGTDASGADFKNQAVMYTMPPGLMTEIVDLAKLYFSTELAEAYQANNLENPTTSMVESLEAISTTVKTESLFGWVMTPVFVGQETIHNIVCNHFTFDQSSFDTAALPADMVVTSASGNLCLAAEGGYLVHGDGKIEGQNLYPSPTSAEIALKSGSIEFAQDFEALEAGFSTAIVPDVLAQVSAPAAIPVPADYRLSMSQIAEGAESYMYISDQAIDEITAYFKTEMPALGWELTSSEESVGTYTYELSKDDLSITVYVVDGVTLPGIKMITFEIAP